MLSAIVLRNIDERPSGVTYGCGLRSDCHLDLAWRHLVHTLLCLLDTSLYGQGFYSRSGGAPFEVWFEHHLNFLTKERPRE